MRKHVIWRNTMFIQGLPVELLLLFTMLVWGLYLLIYLSSPKNKVNQWCCICGFLLSIGILKEYIYYSGIFAGMETQIFENIYQTDELINSILTAVVYYLAMPCVLIFSFYFCHLNEKRPKLFRILTIGIFLPVAAFCVVYPWSHTREIPKEHPEAYMIVAAYNLIYGLIATIPIIITLIRERKSIYFRQRRLVSLIGLLPLWYWLITVFLIHLLKMEKLYKLWQGNAVIIVCLTGYYIWHLFHEGIWGMRLTREYFDWTQDQPALLPGNTRYIIHMLKNEVAKLECCSRSLRELKLEEAEEELNIIDRSVGHIREFVQRSSMYTSEILLDRKEADIRELFQEVCREIQDNWEGEIRTEIREEKLYCDYEHMKEALENLVFNAIEAMGETGILTLGIRKPKPDIVLLYVADTGSGIPQERLPNIFEPYYSGHEGGLHMGLGLAYCRKVVRAHGGYIQAENRHEGTGSVFTICLPIGNRKKRGRKWKRKSSG